MGIWGSNLNFFSKFSAMDLENARESREDIKTKQRIKWKTRHHFPWSPKTKQMK